LTIPGHPDIFVVGDTAQMPQTSSARITSYTVERTQSALPMTRLFDDLVGGGDKRRRQSDAERAGGFQIEDRLKL